MNNCPNCGKELQPGFSFCPSCGFDLRNESERTDNLEINDETFHGEISDDVSSEKADNSRTVQFAICDICGEETEPDTGYCKSCGAKLTGNEEKVARVVAYPETPVKKAETPRVIKTAPDQKKVRENRNKDNRNKPAAARENIRKENKTGNVRSGEIKSSTPQGAKSLSTANIIVLIIAVLALGLVVLEIAGVFDSKPAATANNAGVQNPNASPQISLEALEQINNLEAAVKQDTTNLTSVLQLAHTLNDAGFFERAINYYRMYLRANPSNADVQVDMGVCYFELKKYDQAINIMKKGLAIDPNHQIAHFNLGIVNLSAGNVDSAKIWWQKAVQLNPNSDIGKRAKELLETH